MAITNGNMLPGGSKRVILQYFEKFLWLNLLEIVYHVTLESVVATDSHPHERGGEFA